MNTPEETEFKLPVNVAITSMPRQNTMVFIGGVIAYGVLTMALLATLAVMLGSPLALLGLAATAYANFTFAHAVNAGHFAAIGYHNLVRLTNFTAMLCCIIVLFVAVHLAALAS
jgi:hypothetical protein